MLSLVIRLIVKSKKMDCRRNPINNMSVLRSQKRDYTLFRWLIAHKPYIRKCNEWTDKLEKDRNTGKTTQIPFSKWCSLHEKVIEFIQSRTNFSSLFSHNGRILCYVMRYNLTSLPINIQIVKLLGIFVKTRDIIYQFRYTVFLIHYCLIY